MSHVQYVNLSQSASVIARAVAIFSSSVAERQAYLGVQSWLVGDSAHERQSPGLEGVCHIGLGDGGWCGGILEIVAFGLTGTLLRREFLSAQTRIT